MVKYQTAIQQVLLDSLSSDVDKYELQKPSIGRIQVNIMSLYTSYFVSHYVLNHWTKAKEFFYNLSLVSYPYYTHKLAITQNPKQA